MAQTIPRRSLIFFAGAGFAALRPLKAGSPEFWEKKEPSEWSNEEIDRLLTRSPWAKDVTAQYAPGQAGQPNGYPNDGGGYPNGGGYPGGPRIGIGGLGIPGLGYPRGGGRGGQPRGGQASTFHGTVRWESARPIREAQKSALPDVFAGHYVIAVSGIPLLDDRGQGTRGEDDDSSSRRGQDDSLETLKSLSSLQVRGKDLVQAGVVRRQVGTGSTFLFGFSKEMLPIDKHDGEVAFATQMSRLIVKARFAPKEMLYRGELVL